MFEKLLPKNIDNHYRGMSIAKWVFVAMTILTVGRSLAHILVEMVAHNPLPPSP